MWCRGQISGVCNHTLGGGSDSDIGYRGQSIGFKMIVGQASERASLLACLHVLLCVTLRACACAQDWVPTTTSSKVRLRCTGSMAADGSATIASFSLHKGERPPADGA